jgi:hypothetical protein
MQDVVKNSIGRPIKVTVYRFVPALVPVNFRFAQAHSSSARLSCCCMSLLRFVSRRRVGSGMVELSLIPAQWDGKGLLGCHLADIQ